MKKILCIFAFSLILLSSAAYAYDPDATMYSYCPTCRKSFRFALVEYTPPGLCSEPPGKSVWKCPSCSYTMQVNEFAPHDYVVIEDIEGNCVQEGRYLARCSLCGHEDIQITEPLNPEFGHTWREVGRIDATCTAAGSISYDCSVCYSEKTESFAALGHDFQETSRHPATCIADGSIEYACSRCSEVKSTVLPALAEDHTWVETNSTDPTCTAAGSVEYVCSVCNEVKTESLPAFDHDWTEASRHPATCTNPGSISRVCSRCGFSVSEELPALGSDHTWEETSREEPTTAGPGSVTYTCSICGAERMEVLPAISSGGSMGDVLSSISDIVTVALGWVSVVADSIVRNPILLILVMIGFLGTAVLLFRRLLNL